MPKGGFEPPRPKWTLDPESSASASSAISAGISNVKGRVSEVNVAENCEGQTTEFKLIEQYI